MSEKVITFGDSAHDAIPRKDRLSTAPLPKYGKTDLVYRRYCFHQHLKGDVNTNKDRGDGVLSRLSDSAAQRNAPENLVEMHPISSDTVSALFGEYGAIVSVEDVMKMLHLGQNKVYELLKSGALKTIRCGKKYIIPKQSVIDFITLK